MKGKERKSEKGLANDDPRTTISDQRLVFTPFTPKLSHLRVLARANGTKSGLSRMATMVYPVPFCRKSGTRDCGFRIADWGQRTCDGGSTNHERRTTINEPRFTNDERRSTNDESRTTIHGFISVAAFLSGSQTSMVPFAATEPLVSADGRPSF